MIVLYWVQSSLLFIISYTDFQQNYLCIVLLYFSRVSVKALWQRDILFIYYFYLYFLVHLWIITLLIRVDSTKLVYLCIWIKSPVLISSKSLHGFDENKRPVFKQLLFNPSQSCSTRLIMMKGVPAVTLSFHFLGLHYLLYRFFFLFNSIYSLM